MLQEAYCQQVYEELWFYGSSISDKSAYGHVDSSWVIGFKNPELYNEINLSLLNLH